MGQSVERRSLHTVILRASEGSAFAVIETARGQVAELIGAHSMDVIFTSCATEATEVYSRQLTVRAF
jgi:cysteine sulfinate desulfinase/cysteine desulfurase-like protein